MLFGVDGPVRAVAQEDGDHVEGRGDGDGLAALVGLAGVGVLPGGAGGQVDGALGDAGLHDRGDQREG